MKKRLLKPLKSILDSLPIMVGIILLLGLIKELVTFEKIAILFKNNIIYDTLVGAFSGSIFAGNSMNSYIISKELVSNGVSMYAITAFLVAWVTVGFLQLPIESNMFGKKFAWTRNIVSMFLSVIVAIVTISIWEVL